MLRSSLGLRFRSNIKKRKKIGKHDLHNVLYGDDSYIYEFIPIKNTPHLTEIFEKVYVDVQEWVAQSKLWVNESKTKSIILGE